MLTPEHRRGGSRCRALPAAATYALNPLVRDILSALHRLHVSTPTLEHRSPPRVAAPVVLNCERVK